MFHSLRCCFPRPVLCAATCHFTFTSSSSRGGDNLRPVRLVRFKLEGFGKVCGEERGIPRHACHQACCRLPRNGVHEEGLKPGGRQDGGLLLRLQPRPANQPAFPSPARFVAAAIAVVLLVLVVVEGRGRRRGGGTAAILKRAGAGAGEMRAVPSTTTANAAADAAAISVARLAPCEAVVKVVVLKGTTVVMVAGGDGGGGASVGGGSRRSSSSRGRPRKLLRVACRCGNGP